MLIMITSVSCKYAALLLCLSLCQSLETASVTILPSSSSHSCPANKVCLSLSQLYDYSSDHFEVVSNTTLEFLNLNYQFESTIIIRDASNIKLICPSSPQLLCQLHCINNGSFVFMNITNLWFNGFILYDCGSVIRKDLGHEATTVQVELYHNFVFGLKAAIFAVNVKNLNAKYNVINGSYGYSILGINIIGNSSFEGLLVGYSNIRSFTQRCLQWSPLPPLSESVKCQGGSVLFHYADLPYCPDKLERHTLTLRETQIIKGFDPVGGNYGESFIAHGSGLGIIMAQSYFDVDVYVLGAKLVSNNALASVGSNVYLRYLGKVLYSTITIRNSFIATGNQACTDPGLLKNFTCDQYSYSSSSVFFQHGAFSNFTPSACNLSGYKNHLTNQGTTLLIENSIIDKNWGGGLFIFILPGLIQEDKVNNKRNIAIKQCKIRENVCLAGSACSAQVTHGQKYADQIEYEIIIESTIFANNKYLQDILNPMERNENAFKSNGHIIIVAFRNSTFVNCSFLDNQTPPLLAYDSRMYFEGTNTFDSNTALFGGAIFLQRNAFILLKPNTTMLFQNNLANSKGGAIYIAGGNEASFWYNCPIQVYDPLLTLPSKLGIVMKFVGNTALDSGDALYGGQIDNCLSLSVSGFLYHYLILEGKKIFNNITDFSGQPASGSLISSDALQICLCTENQPNCSDSEEGRINRIMYQYPGEQFQVSVIATGQRGGTVSTVVFTTIEGRSNYDRNYQLTNRTCSNATYSVASSEPLALLLLSAENTIPVRFNSNSTISQIPPIVVQVNLIPCSNLTGFMLDGSSEVCECAQPLRERNMTCDIDTKVITRLPPYWLSNYSNHLLLHDNCPYDYCKPMVVPIIMTEPNISDQCAFDRYGTLCGSCREGWSQVFGTSRCLKCTNIYVLYILLFAVAGIALVVTLLVFNLTVSVGAINGLVFYANIVKINESAFFPPGDVSPFKVFISWLNLDLGIETCFYDGMDSTAKTWLQFLFPLYLWLILAAIIIACRYSIIMVKLFGNNSVEVLATIFLLSYTKLLRTITTVFSSTTLLYPEGQRAVWLYDGNYQFGRGGHLALLFFSVLFFTVIALPYTLLIVSMQLLRHYSNFRLLKWVTKLMPIFDAYLGPYKHKHGYWTGLLLLVRVFLVIVFALNVLGNPSINLFIVRSTAFVIILLNLGLGGVYKNKSLTALEIFYLASLLAVASATSLIRDGDWDQRYAIYSSTILVMLAFFATVVYQAVVNVKEKINRRRAQKMNYIQLKSDNLDLHASLMESVTDITTPVKQKIIPVTVSVFDGKPRIQRYNSA